MDFYDGDVFPPCKNEFLVGSLKIEDFHGLKAIEEHLIYKETILKNAGNVINAACDPDGAIYMVVNRPGTILRLTRQVEM